VAKSPYNKYWYPPVGNHGPAPEWTPSTRQHRGGAPRHQPGRHRKSVSTLGEWGYESPISTATGLILPNYPVRSWPCAQYREHGLCDRCRAGQVPAQGSRFQVRLQWHLIGKDGKAISLSLNRPVLLDDYMADCSVVAVALKSIGIGSSVQGLSVRHMDSDLATGQFNLALYYSKHRAAAVLHLQRLADDTLTAPIGSAAGGDQDGGRTGDAEVSERLPQRHHRRGEEQGHVRHRGIMVNQLPVIPLVYSIDWGAYRTNVVTGWPRRRNPYSSAGPIEPANQEFVILHLHPVSK